MLAATVQSFSANRPQQCQSQVLSTSSVVTAVSTTGACAATVQSLSASRPLQSFVSVQTSSSGHVISSSDRESVPAKNQNSSIPLGMSSFAALVNPANTFHEGTYICQWDCSSLCYNQFCTLKQNIFHPDIS